MSLRPSFLGNFIHSVLNVSQSNGEHAHHPPQRAELHGPQAGEHHPGEPAAITEGHAVIDGHAEPVPPRNDYAPALADDHSHDAAHGDDAGHDDHEDDFDFDSLHHH